MLLLPAAHQGLDDEVVEALIAPHGLRPQRLIYVSCGFKAFKRDAARLLAGSMAGGDDPDGGGHAAAAAQAGRGRGRKRGRGGCRWDLVHAEGHVLFPGSDHIETFAVFDRVLPSEEEGEE